MAAQPAETHETIVVTAPAPAATLQGIRVVWGGVWSGYLVAAGVFLLLTTFGLAVGITAAAAGGADASRARELGVGAAAWSAATVLIALFIGGWAATRTALVHDRAAGIVEGLLVWVLATLTAIYMSGTGVPLLAETALAMLAAVTRGTAFVIGLLDPAGNQPQASAAMWGALAAMLLALIAAVIGAMVGRRQVERRLRTA